MGQRPFILRSRAKMEVVPGVKKQCEDIRDEQLGCIRMRREVFLMPTIERERIITFLARYRLPNLHMSQLDARTAFFPCGVVK